MIQSLSWFRQVALELMPAVTKWWSSPRHLYTPHRVPGVSGVSTWHLKNWLGRTAGHARQFGIDFIWRGGLSPLSFMVPAGSGLEAGFTRVDQASGGETYSRSIGVNSGHGRSMRWMVLIPVIYCLLIGQILKAHLVCFYSILIGCSPFFPNLAYIYIY